MFGVYYPLFKLNALFFQKDGLLLTLELPSNPILNPSFDGPHEMLLMVFLMGVLECNSYSSVFASLRLREGDPNLNSTFLSLVRFVLVSCRVSFMVGVKLNWCHSHFYLVSY